MFAKFIVIVLTGFFFLPACSSNPTTAETSQEQYVSSVEHRLDTMEESAEDFTGARRTDFQAAIRDARASLRDVENAPATDWQTHRAALDNRIDSIQSTYGLAE